MRIGIDARSIGNKICGVSRYSLCLLQALSRIDQENVYIVYTDDLEDIPELGHNFAIRKTTFSRMNPLYDFRFYNQLSIDRLDLFHSFHSWLPMLIPKQTKSIVTIHDIFSVTDPLFFIHRKPLHNAVRYYFKCLLLRTLHQADAVVTVSHYCKKEIIRYFNTLKPIEVIYNSPGMICKDEIRFESRMITGNYIFYLGNFRSYKNVEILLRGFEIYLTSHYKKDITLVLAGNDVGESIKLLAKELNIIDKITFLYKPTDDQIYELYRNASLFVFPSKFEGFGIPPLEAMSFGVPVIIADADALVETSGNAALIFRKDDPQDLANAMHRVLEDAEIRNQLIKSGYETFRLYSWDTSAANLLRLYKTMSL